MALTSTQEISCLSKPSNVPTDYKIYQAIGTYILYNTLYMLDIDIYVFGVFVFVRNVYSWTGFLFYFFY